jgi:RNA recognition motif-containing protein
MQQHQQQGMHGGGGYGGGGGGYGHGGGRPMRQEEKPSRSLWVGNVNPDASDHELQDIFQQFGPVEAVKVSSPLLHSCCLRARLHHRSPSSLIPLALLVQMITHKNCAFVVFADLESAMEAYNNLAHQRPYLRGQELRIGWGKVLLPPPLARCAWPRVRAHSLRSCASLL